MPATPLTQLLILVLTLAASRLTDGNPDLAARIRAGDHEAFRVFFETHNAELDRFLRRMGFSLSDRQDLVQQAFISIWDSRSGLDPSQSIRAFLFRVGRNAGLNLYRSRKRETALTAELEPVTHVDEDTGHEEATLATIVADAVSRLPPRRKEVFELCFLEGLTYREVADVLEISPKTVENQMGHALKSVRAFVTSRREEQQ